MKFLALYSLLISLPVFACWKVEGTVGVDGETHRFHQKIDHGKEYIFPMGVFIFKMTVNQGKEDHELVYVLQEKNGLKITNVTMGKDLIKEGKQEEIMAGGLSGQPNSIITIKLTNI